MIILSIYIVFIIPLSLKNISILIQFLLIICININLFFNSNLFFCSVRYNLGMDNLSYGLVLLSIYIVRLIIIRIKRNSLFYGDLFLLINLILCFCLINIFSVINLLYIYIYFEFSLIPLLIIVFGWGYQPERLISGLYLFFYTLFASLPLLLFFIYIYYSLGRIFINNTLIIKNILIINLIILLAFLVKLPIFILHF